MKLDEDTAYEELLEELRKTQYELLGAELRIKKLEEALKDIDDNLCFIGDNSDAIIQDRARKALEEKE